MLFYKTLVFIHIFSAILGMGPGFILTFIATKAKTMTELRHAFMLRNHIHVFVMTGGILLLITGVLMGFLNTYLFTTGWYWTSLVLYFIALAFGPFILAPLSKPIKALLNSYEGSDIPTEYYRLSGKLFLFERIANSIFIIIIILMIWKPF